MNATPIPQPSSLHLPEWCGGKGHGSEGVNMSPDQKKKIEEEVLVQFVFVSYYTALF